ncbi:MAG: Hsp20/alpha crystallin family protein [Gammaproteobacteria bacterium]|nr:MAG: Hsp20/alpha crystallin family protein [Gammaproteobacteria bacterium]
MNMIHYDPYRFFNRLSNLDRVFDSAFPHLDETEAVSTSDWTPAVDIKEEDQRYLIRADVPGIKPEDIDISLENGVLTIKGERRHESEEEGYKRIERVHGTFFRRFTLPDNVDPDKVDAKCKDGVLEIVIDKQEKVLPKKITVKA